MTQNDYLIIKPNGNISCGGKLTNEYRGVQFVQTPDYQKQQATESFYSDIVSSIAGLQKLYNAPSFRQLYAMSSKTPGQFGEIGTPVPTPGPYIWGCVQLSCGTVRPWVCFGGPFTEYFAARCAASIVSGTSLSRWHMRKYFTPFFGRSFEECMKSKTK